MVKKNSNGYRYAQIFVKRIRNLELKKDYRTNHGEEFTGGRHIWDAVLRY